MLLLFRLSAGRPLNELILQPSKVHSVSVGNLGIALLYDSQRGSQGLSEALGLSKGDVYLDRSTPFSCFVLFLPISIIAWVSGGAVASVDKFMLTLE